MKTAAKPLGLYVHIPFCKQKCAYCDFYSLSGNERLMDDYTDALCAHLTETAPFAAGHTVDTVYFGGGTPSSLGEKRLVQILKTILKKYRVDRHAEITLEANPDSAGDQKALKALRKAGFNRVSLGMQSACEEELREIGRVHTMDQVRAAVEAARKAGFDNLSLDLIYGLPHHADQPADNEGQCHVLQDGGLVRVPLHVLLVFLGGHIHGNTSFHIQYVLHLLKYVFLEKNG